MDEALKNNISEAQAEAQKIIEQNENLKRALELSERFSFIKPDTYVYPFEKASGLPETPLRYKMLS